MHQLCEILTLIQTGKMPRIPIILYDSTFWKPLEEYLKDMLVKKYKTISREDVDLFQIVDDMDKIVDVVNTFRNK